MEPELCPNCRVPVQPGLPHCEACGLQLPQPPPDAAPDAAKESEKAFRAAVRFGRRVLLVVALLTAGLGQLSYTLGTWVIDRIDQGLREEMPSQQSLTFKAELFKRTGRTWREYRESINRGLKVHYMVSIVGALGILGLWYWAQSNAYHALWTAAAISAAFGLYDIAASPELPACGLATRGVILLFLVNGALGAKPKGVAAAATPKRPPPKKAVHASPPDDLGAVAPPPPRKAAVAPPPKRPAAAPPDDIGPVAPPPPRRPHPKRP